MKEVSLYRGDFSKIKHFRHEKTNATSVVGQGIYFTDSLHVAKQYGEKGKDNRIPFFRQDVRHLEYNRHSINYNRSVTVGFVKKYSKLNDRLSFFGSYVSPEFYRNFITIYATMKFIMKKGIDPKENIGFKKGQGFMITINGERVPMKVQTDYDILNTAEYFAKADDWQKMVQETAAELKALRAFYDRTYPKDHPLIKNILPTDSNYGGELIVLNPFSTLSFKLKHKKMYDFNNSYYPEVAFFVRRFSSFGYLNKMVIDEKTLKASVFDTTKPISDKRLLAKIKEKKQALYPAMTEEDIVDFDNLLRHCIHWVVKTPAMLKVREDAFSAFFKLVKEVFNRLRGSEDKDKLFIKYPLLYAEYMKWASVAFYEAKNAYNSELYNASYSQLQAMSKIFVVQQNEALAMLKSLGYKGVLYPGGITASYDRTEHNAYVFWDENFCKKYIVERNVPNDYFLQEDMSTRKTIAASEVFVFNHPEINNESFQKSFCSVIHRK